MTTHADANGLPTRSRRSVPLSTGGSPIAQQRATKAVCAPAVRSHGSLLGGPTRCKGNGATALAIPAEHFPS
jgi:hypothetical protein